MLPTADRPEPPGGTAGVQVVHVGGAVEPPLVGGRGAEVLWSQLPPEVAAAFRRHVPRLGERVQAEIEAAAPGYVAGAGPDDLIMAAVASAAVRCEVAMGLVEPSAEAAGWQRPFREIGRRAHRNGRTQQSLEASFRVAGRGAWHFMAGILRVEGLSADLLCIAADAHYALMDEMTVAAVDGWATAEAAPFVQRERHRAELLDLLTGDGPAAVEELGRLAARAGWDVPGAVVAVALEPAASDAPIVLDDVVLRRLDGPRPCLVTTAPAVHLARLEQRLRGRRAAIGPAVAPERAAESLRCARRALRFVDEGRLPARPVTDCAEFLLPMWLLAEPFLAEQLADTVLGPLGALSRPQRARLGGTLLEWLRRKGNSVEVAAALGVHPQTVRQRLHQLREMFGSALDDPDSRFVMELTLRSMQVQRHLPDPDVGSPA